MKLMRGIWILLALVAQLPSFLSAQIEDPVAWRFDAKQVSDTEFDLIFTASIDPGWHLYSQFVEPGGPVPTGFYFDEASGYEKLGDSKEAGELHREFDKSFEMELAYFSNKAVFTQRVKLNAPQATAKGYLEYMVCDDSKCLPPAQEDFSFSLTRSQAPAAPSKPSPASQVGEPAPPAENPPEESGIGAPQMDLGSLQEVSPNSDAPGGILEPVSWTFGHEQVDADTYKLIFTAEIDEGWKIYASKIEGIGPLPTEFVFESDEAYTLIEEIQEPIAPKRAHDNVFDIEVAYFKHKAIFTQTVNFRDKLTPVAGELGFMACDHEKCLAPEYLSFSIDVRDASGQQSLPVVSTHPEASRGADIYRFSSIDLENPIVDCEAVSSLSSEVRNEGLWGIFFLGLLGGFLALLTPCVFPMIPLTVSFFTKSSADTRKGIMNGSAYGFSIFLIYLLLSVPFYFIESLDPEILNTISTNMWLNLFFFGIFTLFAISFFGYYELTLPSNVATRVDKASSIGGFLGIFFMALTLAIVSFSCTGPILGSLLAGSLSSDGGAVQLTAGMAGFGLALALPFALFAAFPAWLNSLPKSGGWLNSVKVVLGFIELGLAIKFLSNADLVEHWGILKREIFFGAWIIIGIGLTLYLFGKIRFPHDSPIQKLSKGRIALGVLSGLFVLYLLPGVTNTSYANLKLLSGFPPPLFYSIYEKESDCPLELNCFKDYEAGMAYAREVGKPVMLDFTGWACTNCRRMEENVWVKPEIFQRLDEEYVVISLYVDDRLPLPESEQMEIVTRTGKQKKIRTVGNKWATFQTENFNINSQPYYVLLSPDEQLLTKPTANTPDVDEYKAFLDCGLRAYESLSQTQASRE